MFGASVEVVSSAALTRAQSVSRAITSTTREHVEILHARDNGPIDQIGQAHLLVFFGLADVVQYIIGPNLSMKALNLATNKVYTLESKVLCTPLFIAIKWSSPDIQLAKVFHLACKILEGKASLSCLIMAQATKDLLAIEDSLETPKR